MFQLKINVAQYLSPFYTFFFFFGIKLIFTLLANFVFLISPLMFDLITSLYQYILNTVIFVILLMHLVFSINPDKVTFPDVGPDYYL